MSRQTLWVLLAGVFLVSFSLLSFEISLTRVLSVMLYYHYVFIVLSLALLGLGAGGIYVYLFWRRISNGNARFRPLALSVGLFSLSIVLSTIAMTRLAAASVLLGSAIMVIPFFLAGVFLAGVFRMFPELSSRLYGIDLLGAALGALVVVLSLDTLAVVNTIFILGLIASVAALLYAAAARLTFKGAAIPAAGLLVAASLLMINIIGPLAVDIPVDKNPIKEINNILNAPGVQGEIVETRWSAFGRTDLVTVPNDPTQMGIYVDGTSGTSMYRFSGDITRPGPAIAALKTDFPAYLAFSYLKEEERENALVIGPGGGRDILISLMGGVGKITAVEVNRELVDIMHKYAGYNGGLYTDLDNVSVYVDEGRNFLKRQSEKYDIIMLSLPITKTSRSIEGYSLTENFLFTTESINDYLEHLTDEGRLIVVAHDQVEIMRLLSLSMTALNRQGVDDKAVMDQVYIIGSRHFPAFVLKKTPFGPAEMVSIHQAIHGLGYEASLSFLPTIKSGGNAAHVEETRFEECAMLFPPAVALSSGEVGLGDVEGVLRQNSVDISPVTDDSPFFYKFDTGTPESVSLVLWVSLALLLVVALVPAVYFRKRAYSRPVKTKKKPRPNEGPLRFVLLFSMLGAGFMLVEIAAFQKFILFLGQPVLSLAVLLFSLLVGAGLGSLFSARFGAERIDKLIAIVAASVFVLLVTYAFSISFVLERLLGLALVTRLLATVALLAPPGFLMGMLFPSGIRLLKAMKMEGYVPWMWGINGVASVSGSAATIMLAINFGFTGALLLGAACYFIVFLTFQIGGLSQQPGPAAVGVKATG
jgi:MFS family permease